MTTEPPQNPLRPQSEKESEPGSQPFDLHGKPLPSVEQLASISAVVLSGTSTDPHEAVRLALRLWKSTVGVLREEAACPEVIEAYRESSRKDYESGDPPEEFPVALEEFLSRHVKGKTKAVRKSKFREFFTSTAAIRVKSQPGRTKQAEEHELKKLSELEQLGVRSRSEWQFLLWHYTRWDAARHSAAGKKGATARWNPKNGSKEKVKKKP